MYEFPDFVTVGPMPDEVIERFGSQVQPELVEFWRPYGLGSFIGGHLRVIDPAEYLDAIGQQGLDKVTGRGIAIPIMTTAMADLITYEPGDGYRLLLFRNGDLDGLGSTARTLLRPLSRDGEEALDDADHGYQRGPYLEAVATHGVPEYGTSFQFVPLRSLGGPGTVANMRIEDTLTSIQLMIELQAPSSTDPASPGDP